MTPYYFPFIYIKWSELLGNISSNEIEKNPEITPENIPIQTDTDK